MSGHNRANAYQFFMRGRSLPARRKGLRLVVSVSCFPSRSSRCWMVVHSLVPAAAEGCGSFRSSLRRTPDCVARGPAADPDRASVEAARRARSKIRRYCAANVLNRLGALNYRGEGNHDTELTRHHLADFFRDLRTRLGGASFPYAWVPEWHGTGHGPHAHFAVGRFIKRSVIETA